MRCHRQPPLPPPLDHCDEADPTRAVTDPQEPPVATAFSGFSGFRVPTSRVVAAPGSSPLPPPPERSCRTSTAPSPPGSSGRERGRPRTGRARRPGSDRRPPRLGRQDLPVVLGGSPRPPSAPLVAPTCRTRVRGYSGVRPRSGMCRHRPARPCRARNEGRERLRGPGSFSLSPRPPSRRGRRSGSRPVPAMPRSSIGSYFSLARAGARASSPAAST